MRSERDKDLVIRIRCPPERHGRHHVEAACWIEGRPYRFLVGKFNAFVPHYRDEWGLKILKHYPTVRAADSGVHVLDRGAMPDPQNACANLRDKAAELIGLHRQLAERDLGVEAGQDIIAVRLECGRDKDDRALMESDRWCGGETFYGFPVKTVAIRSAGWRRMLPRFGRFCRDLRAFCSEANVRRRRSIGEAVREFTKEGNFTRVEEGYRVFDIDLCYTIGEPASE